MTSSMQELCVRRNLRFTDDLRVKMMGRPGHISIAYMIEHHALVDDTVDGLLEESDLLFTGILKSASHSCRACWSSSTRWKLRSFPRGSPPAAAASMSMKSWAGLT